MRQIPPLSYSSQGITFLRSVQYLCAFNQQVDDLQSIDALEEYIESSAVITIFVSKGYFLSKSKPLPHTGPTQPQYQRWLTLVVLFHADCLREVYCTLALLKPLCLVFDPVRGGAPLPDLEAECDVKLQPAIFGPPDNKRDVIPWHRIKDVCIYHPPAHPSLSPLPSPPHPLYRLFAAPYHSTHSSSSWHSS